MKKNRKEFGELQLPYSTNLTGARVKDQAAIN